MKVLEPCPENCDNGWTDHDDEGVPQRQCDTCRGLGEVFIGGDTDRASKVALAALWYMVDDENVPAPIIQSVRALDKEIMDYWLDEAVTQMEVQADA